MKCVAVDYTFLLWDSLGKRGSLGILAGSWGVGRTLGDMRDLLRLHVTAYSCDGYTIVSE